MMHCTYVQLLDSYHLLLAYSQFLLLEAHFCSFRSKTTAARTRAERVPVVAVRVVVSEHISAKLDESEFLIRVHVSMQAGAAIATTKAMLHQSLVFDGCTSCARCRSATISCVHFYFIFLVSPKIGFTRRFSCPGWGRRGVDTLSRLCYDRLVFRRIPDTTVYR